jgi:hypothetical protein
MKRPERQSDGEYHIKGHTYKNLIGSRQQVWNRTTYKTEGQLQRSDLIMNKWGRIVSKVKHNTAKKENRLQKHGYFAEKGKFGFVKRQSRKSTGSRKKRGTQKSYKTVGKIKISI